MALRLRLLAKAAVRHTSRTAFAAVRARTNPEPFFRPTVVVAPHPDDETFGCGALMARLRAADVPVTVVIVSDGSRGTLETDPTGEALTNLRVEEARSAMTALGVGAGAVKFLGYRDGTLADHQSRICTEVARIIDDTQAENVFVTSSMDRHPDHSATARAVRAARAIVVRPVSLFEYPVWQRVPAMSSARGILRDIGTGPGFRQRLQLIRPVLVPTTGFLTAKQHAIDAYPSQLPLLPPGFIADFLGPHEVFIPVP